MGVKHLLVPLVLGVLVLYALRDGESDPGELTCPGHEDSDLSVRDKVVVVTGGCRGIGYQAALELARRGGRVVLGCRDSGAGRAARERIVAATKGGKVSVIGLDLSRMKHVSAFVYNLKREYGRVDVLINNAATSASKERRETVEGLEVVMATNYLGPLHLTQSLAPLLGQGGVVINMVERRSELSPDLADLNSSQEYDPARVYLQSKQLLHLMTSLTSSQLSPASVYSVQPCEVWSGLHSSLPHQLAEWMAWVLGPFLGDSGAREGARTVVWLAGGGAGGRHSGRAWHSCELLPEETGDVPPPGLRDLSEVLIQRALQS